MSQQRRNPNETQTERTDRLFKESVSNHATRSEKTAWARKQSNLTKFVKTKVNPIEESVRDRQALLLPLYDEANEMRAEMVEFCIHPFDQLVVVDGGVLCRFCNKKLSKPIVVDD